MLEKKKARVDLSAVRPLTLVVAAAMGCFSCGELPADEASTASVRRSALGSTEAVKTIKTLAELRAMTLTGNYKLGNNIDASATANTPFVPIGGVFNAFQGTFDGNGYTIDKLKVAGGEWSGMFGWAINAVLKNIALTNVNVSGNYGTGALVGYLQTSDLSKSYVTGTVTGNLEGGTVGMVVGVAANYAHIFRCYATGTVKGKASQIGGFVGRINSYGDPAIVGIDDFRARLEEIFTNVTVNPTIPSSGTVHAGGLAGYVIGGSIEHINTVGQVTGKGAAGGVVGFVTNDDENAPSTVLRSAISRGIVTDSATPQRAGTIGGYTGNFAYCKTFWDTTTDSGSPPPGLPQAECQIGKTSAQLKAAHPDPNRSYSPYTYGQVLTQADVNSGVFQQCQLGSGSDGDFGFGTCGTTQIWAANTSTEYNTLSRIPNPTVQPK